MHCTTWGYAIVISLLTGCSASIPVTKLNGTTPPKWEGLLLTLPRTALTVKYNVVATTFTVGKWTDEVESCQTYLNFSDTTTPAQRRAKLADIATAESCVLLNEIGLETKRPSFPSDAIKCGDAGAATEKKTNIDAGTLAITGAPTPDPNHMYWVSTPSRWLSDVDVLVKYTQLGTIDGAKSIATNPWSDFAVNVTSMALKATLPGIGSPPTRNAAPVGAPPPQCRLLLPSECKEFMKDLDDLKSFVGQGYQAAQLSAGPLFDKQMELFDARVKAQRVLFEGMIATKTTAKTALWFPEEQVESATSAHCRAALAANATPQYGEPRDAGWTCWSTFDQFETICPSLTRGRPAPAYPREEVHSAAWVTAAGVASRSGFGLALMESVKGFKRHGTDSARGFPYRMPVDTQASALVRRCSKDVTQATVCTPRGAPTTVSLAVAQYGQLGRLTPRAGGRKGTIEVDYNADTGGLTTVQVTGEGSNPKPITDVLQSKLTPAPEPTEMDMLKAEKERIEALAAVCKAYASLSAEAPDYCM